MRETGPEPIGRFSKKEIFRIKKERIMTFN